MLNKAGERFVNELLPRDVLTQKVYEQMKRDNMPFVRLSLAPSLRRRSRDIFLISINDAWKRDTM